MDELKFTCPKCASDRVVKYQHRVLMRCRACDYKSEPSTFKLERRGSLKWDEATEIRADQ